MNNMDTREKVEKLIKNFVGTKNVKDMYGGDHKLAKEAVEGLHDILKDILEDVEEITIGVVGGEIAFEKEPFYETSKKIKGFIKHLKKIDVEKFSFGRGIDRKELEDFIDILNRRPSSDAKAGDIEKDIERAGIVHIAVGKIGIKKDEEESQEEINIETLMEDVYSDGAGLVDEMAKDLRESKPIDLKSARQFISGITGNLLKNKELLRILTSTRSHDESTFVHEVNVSVFTLLQAESLGIKGAELNDIGIAALLHDAGKLAVSGDVIRKKGGLTQEDRVAITGHPTSGAKILLETPDVGILAAIGAFEHHIKYDMTGYPKKLYGDKLSLVTMMTTIADYYDALRSERSYHEGAAPEKVYEDMMKISGEFFNPDLLDNFFNIVGVYPPGTLVELDTKEIGLVIRESTLDIKRPQVEVLYSSKGEKLKAPRSVNLLEKDEKEKYRWTIVRSIAPSDRFKAKE